MKGFKDKAGKFRPTEKKTGVRKSRDQSAKTQGIRLKRNTTMNEGEPILETELTDIFGDVEDEKNEGQINYFKLQRVVEEGIIEILKREGKWDNDYHVIIKHVSSRPETQDESGFYQYDYFIWYRNESTPLGGTVYGQISASDVLDMDLELYRN